MQVVERSEAGAFGVDSYDVDGGHVVALRGELDVSTRHQLASHAAGSPGALVVFDLSQLTFIDSSGLGAVHAARQQAITRGGTLVVSRPTPMVQRVFEITGLDTWIADWDPAWSRHAGARTEATS
jgi:anti-anti-sigma factor